MQNLDQIARDAETAFAATSDPDTLEQIFRISRILGYRFDIDTPPRTTDIRTGRPWQRTKEQR